MKMKTMKAWVSFGIIAVSAGIGCTSNKRVYVTDRYTTQIAPTYPPRIKYFSGVAPEPEVFHEVTTGQEYPHDPPYVYSEPPGKPLSDIGAQPKAANGNTIEYLPQTNIYGEPIFQQRSSGQYRNVVPGGKNGVDVPLYNSWVRWDSRCKENEPLYRYSQTETAMNLPLRVRMLRGYWLPYEEFVKSVHEFSETNTESVLGIAEKTRDIYQRIETERVKGLKGDALVTLYTKEFGLNSEDIHEVFMGGIAKKHVYKVQDKLNISYDAAEVMLNDMHGLFQAAYLECEKGKLCPNYPKD